MPAVFAVWAFAVVAAVFAHIQATFRIFRNGNRINELAVSFAIRTEHALDSTVGMKDDDPVVVRIADDDPPVLQYHDALRAANVVLGHFPEALQFASRVVNKDAPGVVEKDDIVIGGYRDAPRPG